MTVPFSLMPANWRLPGGFVEISNAKAMQAEQQFKVLFIGQRLASGSVAAETLTRITSKDQGDADFGRGAMLTEMLRLGKAVDPFTETWAVALDENAVGVAANKDYTISGAATADGTMTWLIDGVKVPVGVSSGDSATTIGDAVVAAVAADTTLPVTVTNALGVLTFVAKWKGESGNNIDIRLNYYQGEKLPEGVTVDIMAGTLANGTTNPDITPALAALGNEQFNWIVCPYTDAANLAVLENWLDSRWGPVVQADGRAFAAYRGNHAATGTFGSGRNHPHVSYLATNTSPQAPYKIAAINAMTVANPLAQDPARPLSTLHLVGMLPPANSERWTDSERNLLLFDGMSTYYVDPSGRCHIERQITSYQTNDLGVDDISYLNIQRPETLSRIRYEQVARVSKFIVGRYKLSGTDEQFGAGEPILNEDSIRAELLALYKDVFMERGWCEDFEYYKATIVIEIDTATGRVDWKDEPQLVGQAHTFAGLMQFGI